MCIRRIYGEVFIFQIICKKIIKKIDYYMRRQYYKRNRRKHFEERG